MISIISGVYHLLDMGHLLCCSPLQVDGSSATGFALTKVKVIGEWNQPQSQNVVCFWSELMMICQIHSMRCWFSAQSQLMWDHHLHWHTYLKTGLLILHLIGFLHQTLLLLEWSRSQESGNRHKVKMLSVSGLRWRRFVWDTYLKSGLLILHPIGFLHQTYCTPKGQGY